MSMNQNLQIRLMTYNIGGGRRDFGSDFDKVVSIIREQQPDILAVQEATEHQLSNGRWESLAEKLATKAGFENNFFFGNTISMREQFHIGKTNFIYALFDDWLDLKFGNALFSRRKFVGLGDPSIPAVPKSIPVFYPPRYQGNRDTDERKVLLGRVNYGHLQPFILATHLTTLVGERGNEEKEIPGKKQEAQQLRREQCKNILNLIRNHILDKNEIAFLMGDFNATVGEPCLSDELEGNGGFVRLIPENENNLTHLKHGIQIDHIFMFPAERLVDYKCHIIDSETARQASDHLPVVADVIVK